MALECRPLGDVAEIALEIGVELPEVMPEAHDASCLGSAECVREAGCNVGCTAQMRDEIMPRPTGLGW
jgi:hypothetical protein